MLKNNLSKEWISSQLHFFSIFLFLKIGIILFIKVFSII